MKSSLRLTLRHVLTCSVGAGVLAYGQVPVHIEVSDARPLKAAIDVLEDALGVPINYEDAPFANATDLQDMTEQVQSPQQRAANPGVRIIVPKGGALTLDFPLPASVRSVGDALPLVRQLLIQHEANGYPGRFRVQQLGSVATVQPTAVRSSAGSWENITPAMETRISFPTQERNAGEALKLFAGTLSERLRVKVGVGRLPLVAFANATVTTGANDEPANRVLVRLFEQMSAFYSNAGSVQPFYSYRLLYDPGLKYYLLHISAVVPKANQGAPRPAKAVEPPPEGFLLNIPGK